MNKALILSLFSVLLFYGCESGTDIYSPIILSDQQEFKINSSNPSDSTNPTVRVTNLAADIEYEGLFVSRFVDGSIKSELILDTTYINSKGRIINVCVSLSFYPGVFQGIRQFTMIVHPEDLTIEFFPHMVFNDAVVLNYTITGLDLEDMGYTQNSSVDFVYFEPNGGTEIIQNTGCNIHIQQQRISLHGGRLYHFSRYGWVREQQ
jgi:hypothetical protein